jgi:thiosulfate reductase cytochrome b subunit
MKQQLSADSDVGKRQIFTGQPGQKLFCKQFLSLGIAQRLSSMTATTVHLSLCFVLLLCLVCWLFLLAFSVGIVTAYRNFVPALPQFTFEVHRRKDG